MWDHYSTLPRAAVPAPVPAAAPKTFAKVEDVFAAPDASCSHIGHCGRAYQACCAAFAAKGFPCQCHLAPGDGESGKCGDCGTGFAACCIGYKAKGFPCTCDVQ